LIHFYKRVHTDNFGDKTDTKAVGREGDLKVRNMKLYIFLVVALVRSGLADNWGDVGDDCVDPKAKCVIRAMDDLIANHVEWDNKTAWVAIMEQFFTEDMIYDTNYNPNADEMNNSTGIEAWFYAEHIPYNLAFDNVSFSQMIFASEEETATTTTYAKSQWKGDIGTIPGSEKIGLEVTMRIYDFYIMRGNKIFYNWMLLDFVELMYYAGYRVLPKSPLREGWVQAPAAMDGIPAPISRLVNPMDSLNAKILVEETLLHDIVYGSEASPIWTEDMKWYGPFGIGYASNKQDYEEYYLKPLKEGISDRQVEINVLTCEGPYCGVNGFIHGVHSGPWLGEEATNLPIRIRFGFHYRVDVQNKVIPEGYALFDIPDALNQVGVNLFDRFTPEYAVDGRSIP